MSKKDLALKQAIDQINTSHGKGSIMFLGQCPSPRHVPVVSTGSFALDIALGVGGFPKVFTLCLFLPFIPSNFIWCSWFQSVYSGTCGGDIWSRSFRKDNSCPTCNCWSTETRRWISKLLITFHTLLCSQKVIFSLNFFYRLLCICWCRTCPWSIISWSYWCKHSRFVIITARLWWTSFESCRYYHQKWFSWCCCGRQCK